MTSHAKQIIEQRLTNREIIAGHHLFATDPITHDTTLDIRLNASAIPAANDAGYDAFVRNVSDSVFDRMQSLDITPSEVWLHDDTNAPQPIITYTFDAEDWAHAAPHKEALIDTLNSMTSPRLNFRPTYVEEIAENVRRQIKDASQPLNDDFFDALMNDNNAYKLANILEDNNMEHVTLTGFGYNSIVMSADNNDEFVIRITAEDREPQHHIPQILNPVFRDGIADNLWIEVLPKIRAHGVTDEHKNALLDALEEKNLTLEQDDIGLLPLTDGTMLPISYDTTNVSAPDAHNESWEWRDNGEHPSYDWESDAVKETYDAHQHNFEAHVKLPRVNTHAEAANESIGMSQETKVQR